MKNEHRLAFQTLDAYLVAKELARRVHEAKITDPELRDQANRAAKSAFLHVCEGLPNRSVAMRRRYFVGSENSLYEALGAMDLAATIRTVRDEDADAVQELGARLQQILRGLMR